jgi:hypothetical protein
MGNSGQRPEQSHQARIDKQHPQHGATTAIVVETVFLVSTTVLVPNGWDADRWAGRPHAGHLTFCSIAGTGWFLRTSEDLMSLVWPDNLVDTSKYFALITDFPRNGISLSPSNAGPILSNPSFAELSVWDRQSQFAERQVWLSSSHLASVFLRRQHLTRERTTQG